MSIGVRLLLSGPVSALSVPLFAIHTHTYIQIHTHTQPNTFRALYPSHSQTNTQTSRAPLFLLTNMLTQTSRLTMVQSRHRPMKNACPFACFIRNTHQDSIPISPEIPHRNINYESNLGGSLGREFVQLEYGIHSVILMRGSLSPGADYKIHIGPECDRMLVTTAVGS